MWRRQKLTCTPSDLFHLATTSSHGLQREYSAYSPWLKRLHTYLRFLPQSPRTHYALLRHLHLPRNECRPDYDLVNSARSENRHLLHVIRRTHVVFSHSRKINNLLNIVLSQDILWANARPLKDSGRSKCPCRKNNKTWRPSHQWLSSTLCSSNCIVNIFNPYCTSTSTMNGIIST